MTLPAGADLLAPDGSEVRVLLSLAAGSMAHFRLAAAQVSRAVRHRSVEEIWYVLSGAGDLWRSHGGREEVFALSPGVCLTIPVGVRFQFRAADGGPLAVVAVTMPPWPGDSEAEAVAGKWPPTVDG
ncbi:cupin domain-containing protein [Rhodopila sp.]|uniref:cupin domain-containing protein n=1 Tax=Rhodopila sp. TaxID=2480087 RepID=UPI003D09CBC4